jgi:hypothetical protein
MTDATNQLIAGLPGEALVREGLDDFASGRRTIAACLVAMSTERLGRAGLMAPPAGRLIPEPELQLYRLLDEPGCDAYSRYNALVRELVSFESALDRRCRTALG